MSTAKRIEELLAAAVCIPVKDGAGIVTPAGIDAGVRVKTLRECLEIAREEGKRHENISNK
jgi:hypothetical protein